MIGRFPGLDLLLSTSLTQLEGSTGKGTGTLGGRGSGTLGGGGSGTLGGRGSGTLGGGGSDTLGSRGSGTLGSGGSGTLGGRGSDTLGGRGSGNLGGGGSDTLGGGGSDTLGGGGSGTLGGGGSDTLLLTEAGAVFSIVGSVVSCLHTPTFCFSFSFRLFFLALPSVVRCTTLEGFCMGVASECLSSFTQGLGAEGLRLKAGELEAGRLCTERLEVLMTEELHDVNALALAVFLNLIELGRLEVFDRFAGGCMVGLEGWVSCGAGLEDLDLAGGGVGGAPAGVGGAPAGVGGAFGVASNRLLFLCFADLTGSADGALSSALIMSAVSVNLEPLTGRVLLCAGGGGEGGGLYGRTALDFCCDFPLEGGKTVDCLELPSAGPSTGPCLVSPLASPLDTCLTPPDLCSFLAPGATWCLGRRTPVPAAVCDALGCRKKPSKTFFFPS